jgi:hypothetical protein
MRLYNNLGKNPIIKLIINANPKIITAYEIKSNKLNTNLYCINIENKIKKMIGKTKFIKEEFTILSLILLFFKISSNILSMPKHFVSSESIKRYACSTLILKRIFLSLKFDVIALSYLEILNSFIVSSFISMISAILLSLYSSVSISTSEKLSTNKLDICSKSSL